MINTMRFVRCCLLSVLFVLAAAPQSIMGRGGEQMGSAPSLERRFKPPYYSTGGDPGGVVLVDLNRDGKLDLVSGARTDSGQAVIRTRLGRGDGSFEGRYDYPARSFPSSIAAGDLTDDGWPDLLVGYNSGDGQISRFVNTALVGPDLLAPRTDFTASLTRSVAIADLNQDGKNDLIVGSSSGSGVGVFFGQGGGVFSVWRDLPLPTSYRIAISDIDTDGLPDVVAVGRSGVAEIAHNQGQGQFARIGYLLVGANKDPQHVAVGEVNGDGRPDIVTSNNSDGSVTVFESTGAPLQFRTGVCYPVTFESRPTGIALRDLTGDGLDEIVVAQEMIGQENSEFIRIMENTKHGEFVGGTNVTVERQPMTVVIADSDNNGCVDIFVGSGQIGSDRGGITVLRDTSCDPIPSCLSDLNRDGFVNTIDLILFLGDFGDECR